MGTLQQEPGLSDTEQQSTKATPSPFRQLLLVGITSIFSLGLGILIGQRMPTSPYLSQKQAETTPKPIPEKSGWVSSGGSYTNNKLEGMSFTYDTTGWDSDETNESNEKLILNQSRYLGKLEIQPRDPAGVGGGYLYIYTIEYLSNGIARIGIGDGRYLYGFTESVHLYQKNPGGKKGDLDMCVQIENGTYEGMTTLSTKTCQEIRAGKIIGSVEQPSFSWSPRLKSTTPLNRTDFEDFGDYMIIEVSYNGPHPEEADKIVSQIPFINKDKSSE